MLHDLRVARSRNNPDVLFTGGGPAGVSAAVQARDDAVACSLAQAVLGEGLRWDARRDEILGVDILAGEVYRGQVRPDGSLSLLRAYQVASTVGAIAPATRASFSPHATTGSSTSRQPPRRNSAPWDPT